MRVAAGHGLGADWHAVREAFWGRLCCIHSTEHEAFCSNVGSAVSLRVMRGGRCEFAGKWLASFREFEGVDPETRISLLHSSTALWAYGDDSSRGEVSRIVAVGLDHLARLVLRILRADINDSLVGYTLWRDSVGGRLSTRG